MQSKRRNASNKRPKTLKILAVVAGLTVLIAPSIVSAQLTDILEDVLISSVTASTGGGTGVATLRLRSGQLFAVDVDPKPVERGRAPALVERRWACWADDRHRNR